MNNFPVKYTPAQVYEYSAYEPFKYPASVLRKIYRDLLKLAVIKNEYLRSSNKPGNSGITFSEAAITAIVNSLPADELIIDSSSNFIPEIVRDSSFRQFQVGLKKLAERDDNLNRKLLRDNILRFESSGTARLGVYGSLIAKESGGITVIQDLDSEVLEISKLVRFAAELGKRVNIVLVNRESFWKTKEELRTLLAGAGDIKFFSPETPNILEVYEIASRYFSFGPANLLLLNARSEEFMFDSSISFESETASPDALQIYEIGLTSRGILRFGERDRMAEEMRASLKGDNPPEITAEYRSAEALSYSKTCNLAEISSDLFAGEKVFPVVVNEGLLVMGGGKTLNVSVSAAQIISFILTVGLLSSKPVMLRSDSKTASTILNNFSVTKFTPDFPLIIECRLNSVAVGFEAQIVALKEQSPGSFSFVDTPSSYHDFFAESLKKPGVNIVAFNGEYETAVKELSSGSMGMEGSEVDFICAGSDATVVAWGSGLFEASRYLEENQSELEIIAVHTNAGPDLDLITESVKKTGRCILCPDAFYGVFLTTDLLNILNLRCYQFLDAPVAVASPINTASELDGLLGY